MNNLNHNTKHTQNIQVHFEKSNKKHSHFSKIRKSFESPFSAYLYGPSLAEQKIQWINYTTHAHEFVMAPSALLWLQPSNCQFAPQQQPFESSRRRHYHELLSRRAVATNSCGARHELLGIGPPPRSVNGALRR